MTPEAFSGKWRRRCLLFAVVLFCVPISGCSLLYDEFTWLDRLPPPVDTVADTISAP